MHIRHLAIWSFALFLATACSTPGRDISKLCALLVECDWETSLWESEEACITWNEDLLVSYEEGGMECRDAAEALNHCVASLGDCDAVGELEDGVVGAECSAENEALNTACSAIFD